MRTIFFIFFCIPGVVQLTNAQVLVSGANSLTPNGNFLTVASAFNAINARPQGGLNITITITSNTNEVAQAMLLQGSAPWASLLIRPQGHVTVFGNLLSPLVFLNGSDNVTINGFNNAGNSLTIENSGASVSSNTVRFANDANNNTLTNCVIKGSSTGNPNAIGEGAVVFVASTTIPVPTGNDNIIISNNDIGPSTSLPYVLVKGAGFANATNNNVTITNNKLHDFFSGLNDRSRGIFVGPGCSDWTISQNKIYQSAPRQWTGSATNVYSCIEIKNTSVPIGNNFSVTGNTLGYQDSLGNGSTVITHGGTAATNWPSRIHALVFDIPGSNNNIISGNTISSFDLKSSHVSTAEGENIFIGIFIKSGLATVSQNLVGSMNAIDNIIIRSSAVTIPFGGAMGPAVGIYLSGNGITTAIQNQIGGITILKDVLIATGCDIIYFVAIYSLNINLAEIRDNTVGGTIAASIKNTHSGASINGINCQGGQYGGSSKITGNIIRNLEFAGDRSSLWSNPQNCGILIKYGIAGDSIRGNSITNLNITGDYTPWVDGMEAINVGILSLFGDTGIGITINKNVIHSFFTPASVHCGYMGIIVNIGKYRISNNMISLGKYSGNQDIWGIYQWGNTNVTACYNSIRVYGSANSSASPHLTMTAAYVMNSSSSLNLYNNILINEKPFYSNIACALYVSPNYTGHHNIVYRPTIGLPTIFNGNYDQAGWFALTGQEPLTSSKTGYVNFFSLNDLHTNDTIVRNSAIPIAGITDDIDGDTRSCPDIGADEFETGTIGGTDFTWVGGVNDLWCEPCNWDRDTVPPAWSNVIIADECNHYPFLQTGCGDQEVNNFTVQQNSAAAKSGKIDLGQYKLSVSGNINISGTCTCTGVSNASNINQGLFNIVSATTQQTLNIRNASGDYPGEICKLRINKTSPTMIVSSSHEAILKGNLRILYQFDLANGVLLSQTSNTYDADQNTALNFKTINILNDDPASVSRQIIPSQNIQNGFFMGRLNRKIRQGTNGDEYLFPLGFRTLNGPGNIQGCFYTPAMLKFSSVSATNYLTGTYLNDNNNYVVDGINLGIGGDICGSAGEIDDQGGNTAMVCNDKEIDEMGMNYWDFRESSGPNTAGDPVTLNGALGSVQYDIQTGGDVYNLTTTDGLNGSQLRLMQRTGVTLPGNTGQGPWNSNIGVHSGTDISTNPGIALYTVGLLDAARRNNVTVFGGFGAAGNGLSALLVDLLNFDAELVDNNRTVCSWTTASEFRSDHFIVEYAPETVSPSPLVFQKIGTVDAAGFSNDIQHYSIVDTISHSGLVYFRLTLVDLDGNHTYSDMVALLYSANGQMLQFSMPSPNPVTSETSMKIFAQKDTDIKFNLIDKTGRTVYSFDRDLTAGENNISLGFFNNYNVGVYSLELTTNNLFRVFRLVIANSK